MQKTQKPNGKKGKVGKGEPVFLVRPVAKKAGLDYLHLSLMVLVVILVGVALALSFSKPGTVVKGCEYGSMNGTCIVPQHNATQVLSAAMGILAAYKYSNTSLSLLPYYIIVNQSKASYIPGEGSWLVTAPYVDPFAHNVTYGLSLVLYDSNLSLRQASLSTLAPNTTTNDSVSAYGAVEIGGKEACSTKAPIPVYLVTDPYAPGAIQAIQKAINASTEFAGSINMSYYMIFTDYAVSHYNVYGQNTTQALGYYLYCSSKQAEFPAFVANLSKVYDGNPISEPVLQSVAQGSGLNTSELADCVGSSTSALDSQLALAQLYGVATNTPAFVVNCKYQALPQTIGSAIDYALGKV